MSAAINIVNLPSLLLPRGVVIHQMRQWAKMTMWGLRTFAGTHIEIRNPERIPQGAGLIASKHQSMFETIMAHVLLRDPAIVLKKQLTYIPFYGWFGQKAEMIVVDRGAHAKALRKMIKDAQKCAADGRQIMIYPEGTRKAPGAEPDYKPGIAALYTHLDLPCIPIALNSGHFWPRRGFIRRPGTIVVEVLEPIPPGLKRKEFMATLETRIEEATERLAREVPARPGAKAQLSTSTQELG